MLPLVLFEIGPIKIYSFGLMLALGFIVGLYFLLQEGKRKGLNEEKLLNFALLLIVTGVVGARLMYIVLYPSDYLANPLEVFRISHGGLAFHGGLLGGIIAGIFFCRKTKIPFWQLADATAPALAIGYGIARIGCDLLGRPTNVPWAIYRGGQWVHPVQLYCFGVGLTIFLVLCYLRDKLKIDGQLFLVYAILYSIARTFIELFRYSKIAFGSITVPQVESAIIIVIAGSLLVYSYFKHAEIA